MTVQEAAAELPNARRRARRSPLAAQRQQWRAVDNTLRGIWMKAYTV